MARLVPWAHWPILPLEEMSHPGLRRAAWYLGVVLEIVHIPGAIGIFIFGRLWLPTWFLLPLSTLLIGLQVAVLGCPWTVLTHWLRARYRAEPAVTSGSFTYWLYHRYGRWIGVPVLLATVSSASFVAYLLS